MDTENKGDVTFKPASVASVEKTEPVVERPDSEVSVSTEQVDVDVPVALYADLKGMPYSAKYFEVEKIWDNKDMGMKDELERIDRVYKSKVQKGELADGTKSYEAFIKEAEKVTKSSLSPSHVRISKIASYLSFMANLKAIDNGK